MDVQNKSFLKRESKFHSGHSKIIKRSIAMSCLKQFGTKLSPHKTQERLRIQAEKLTVSRHPEQFISEIAESLLKKIKTASRTGIERIEKKNKYARPPVLLYVHNLSHRLKKIGEKHDAFSPSKKSMCGVKHKNQQVDCVQGVIY